MSKLDSHLWWACGRERMRDRSCYPVIDRVCCRLRTFPHGHQALSQNYNVAKRCGTQQNTFSLLVRILNKTPMFLYSILLSWKLDVYHLISISYQYPIIVVNINAYPWAKEDSCVMITRQSLSGLPSTLPWRNRLSKIMAYWFHRNPLKATAPVTFDLHGVSTNDVTRKLFRYAKDLMKIVCVKGNWKIRGPKSWKCTRFPFSNQINSCLPTITMILSLCQSNNTLENGHFMLKIT